MASPFPENYEDLSTDKGFQFKFYCDICSEGFTSRFTPIRRPQPVEPVDGRNRRGGAATADIGEVAYAATEADHMAALRRGVAEMERQLRFCKECEQWVCVRTCWNAERKLCVDCAPDESEDSAHGDASAEEVGPDRGPRGSEEPIEPVQRNGKRVGGPRLVECLNCRSMVEDRSFCSECGESLRGANVCPDCDADVAAGAKFCPVCGAKL